MKSLIQRRKEQAFGKDAEGAAKERHPDMTP
jgi:hypothetical protein